MGEARYSAEKGTRRRNGRGQISSIDALPEVAREAIGWANAQLRDRKMRQNDILRGFNAMLAEHGIPPISRSAFSRHSVGLAIDMRQKGAARELLDVVSTSGAQGAGDGAVPDRISLQKLVCIDLLMSDKLDYRELEAATRLLVSFLKGAERHA